SARPGHLRGHPDAHADLQPPRPLRRGESGTEPLDHLVRLDGADRAADLHRLRLGDADARHRDRRVQRRGLGRIPSAVLYGRHSAIKNSGAGGASLSGTEAEREERVMESSGSDQQGRIAFVQSLWHRDIVDECRDSFLAEVQERGIAADQVDLYEVTGAFEIPLHAKRLAESGRYAAIVAAGLVVDG